MPEAVPGGGTAPGSGSQAGSAGTGAVATTGASGGGADSGTVPAASTGSTADETGTASSTTSASQAIEAPGGAYAVSQSDRGVVLILFDLRFVADSDQLLTGEKPRLDAIAEALKRIPDRTFLVEGHAADVGKPQGQYQLSEARAKRIVDELVARGIPASRFIYRGLGGDVPLAPNDTEQGRARNRRVEITVLN
ncbi:MAG: OmpA family protein [Spirochaetia bacterium]|nr:OmpA family protein [Spirochaetia bacterium]